MMKVQALMVTVLLLVLLFSAPAPSQALGNIKQDPTNKPQKLLPQPFRSRSPRLSHRLKGYGKFNGDTHLCHSIQSQPCQKPSDCDGCLGLYTCKLPTTTCVLKAVSRQRGGFLQTIQSPVGHRVLLITKQRRSM